MKLLSIRRHAVIVAIAASLTVSIKCTTAQVVTYINPIDITNRPIDVSKPVGSTAGQANVTPGGAVTYLIPIFCPPGTNGMQPSLTIAYSSQAGNGTLGWGFDLFGLSAVSRVAKTMIQDDSLCNPRMAKSDVFAIDGNRLYAASGAEGANWTTYISEMADFNTISSNGVSGNGPLWFKVITADGTVKEYGNTTDSRTVKAADNPSTIGVWRLNKVTDLNGNYITYEYNSTSGLITRIAYTGNTAAGLQPYNEILFTYGTRVDVNTTYPFYNAPVTDLYLLTDISVKAEGALVKKYHFNYNRGANDLFSLLNEIVESDGYTNILNSTVISWGDKLNTGSNAMTIKEQMVPQESTNPCNYSLDIFTKSEIDKIPAWWAPDLQQKRLNEILAPVIMKQHSGTLFGDLNGDGFIDAFKMESAQLLGPLRTIIKWNFYASNTGGYDPNILPDASGSIANTLSSLFVEQSCVADINGDGRDEIFLSIFDPAKTISPGLDSIDMVCYQLQNNVLVELPQYTLHNMLARGLDQIYEASVAYADLDGDQNANDIIVHSSGYDFNNFYNTLPFTNNFTLPTPALNVQGDFDVIDFNGNCKPDIMRKWKNGQYDCYDIYEKKGNTYPKIFSFSLPLPTPEKLYTGDFNGDGKTDLLYYQPGSEVWNMVFSTGKSLALPVAPILPGLDDYSNMSMVYVVLTGDYNGDGKTDVLIATSDPSDFSKLGNISVYYSYGANFKKFDYGLPAVPSVNPLGFKVCNAGDINNDGKDEIYFPVTTVHGDACSEIHTWVCSFDDGKTPTLVKSIVNGFNQATSFTYKKLTDPALYTCGNNADQRLRNMRFPVNTAASITQPDGIGGTSTTNFSYEGGLLHKFGKGFLGFSKVIAENATTGIRTESIYSLNSSTLMMNLSEEKRYINGNLISSVQNYYGYAALYGSNGHGYYKGVFPFTSQTTETDALSGITKTTAFTYGTTTNIIATKGNPLNVLITYGNDGTESTTYTYVTANYTTANGTLSLTKPSATLETRVASGQTSFVKKTSFTYQTSGRLWKTTEWANQTKTILTTFDYTGNSFGLATKITTTTTGIPGRYKNCTYDSRGRFMLTETNMLGQTTSYQYNAAFGAKSNMTDISGNVTTYLYDSYGRLKVESLPQGIQNLYNIKWDNSVNNGLYYIEEIRGNSPDSKTWYDASGRQVYHTTEGFNGALIYTEKEYTAKGQLLRESKPHYGNEIPKWICNTYEPNTARLATTSNDGLLTTYSYNGKKLTVTDPAGRSSSKTINNFGQVVSTTDDGGSVVTAYYSNGKPKTITTNGSTLSFVYDVYGNLNSQTDPNSGTTSFTYNIYGELTLQKDAKLNQYSFTYDNAGRQIKKTGPDGNYVYAYVTTTNGKGRLASITAPSGSVTYTYNVYGLPTAVSEIISGATYTFNYVYDNLLNNTWINYPGEFFVNNVYNTQGELTEVRVFGQSVWKNNGENAQGQIRQEMQGNGITTDYSYDQYNRLTAINSQVQHDSYTYDNATGNLTSRSDLINNLTETFTYDNFDRLQEVIMNGLTTKTMTYAANGNINSKTDAGIYTYDLTKKNAAIKIVGKAGSTAIPTFTQDVTYTPFNKILTVIENSKKLMFTYGPDQQRNKMSVYNGTTLVKSRIYCGLYEKETMASGATKDYCYIATPNGVTAVAINGTIFYLRKDRQGSITGIFDGNKVLQEAYSYDAWGRRRNPQNWSYTGFATPTVLTRGYTFHEHLDDFGLINMNGRCYDPVTGRFMSPDPVIQAPGYTQSYNRYSYCLNNPLKYTDPSGYRFGYGDASGEMMQNINNALQWKFNTWYCGFKQNVKRGVLASLSAENDKKNKNTGGNSVSTLTVGQVLAAVMQLCPEIGRMMRLPGNDGGDGEPKKAAEPSQTKTTNVCGLEIPIIIEIVGLGSVSIPGLVLLGPAIVLATIPGDNRTNRHESAGKGNESYPGPWTYTVPDPTGSFYNPPKPPDFNPGDNNAVAKWIVGTALASKLLKGCKESNTLPPYNGPMR